MIEPIFTFTAHSIIGSCNSVMSMEMPFTALGLTEASQTSSTADVLKLFILRIHSQILVVE